jgi:hypothetical protein
MQYTVQLDEGICLSGTSFCVPVRGRSRVVVGGVRLVGHLTKGGGSPISRFGKRGGYLFLELGEAIFCFFVM